jgi:predicted nicotinamide N-methyase
MSAAAVAALQRIIKANTVARVTARGLHLRTIDDLCALYHCRDDSEAKAVFHGHEPYWPFLWAGGWALAEHVYRHRELCRETLVLDIGCGGGICGLAALQAESSPGADNGVRAFVVFNDIDPVALAAVDLNLQASFSGSRYDSVRGRALLEPVNMLDLPVSELGQRIRGYREQQRAAQRLQAVPPTGPDKLQLSAVRHEPGNIATDWRKQDARGTVAEAGAEAEAEGDLLVLCGDVMYDTQMGAAMLRLLHNLLQLGQPPEYFRSHSAAAAPVPASSAESQQASLHFSNVTVLMGDPGRHAFKALVGDTSPGAPTDGPHSPLQQLVPTVVGRYSPSLQPDDAPSSAHSQPLCRVEGLDGFEGAADGGEVAVVQLTLPSTTARQPLR